MVFRVVFRPGFVDRHLNIKLHNIIFLTVFSHQKKQFYSVLDSLKSLYNDKTHLAQQPITLVHIIVSSLPPYSSPSDCQSSANATQERFCTSFRAYFRHVSLYLFCNCSQFFYLGCYSMILAYALEPKYSGMDCSESSHQRIFLFTYHDYAKWMFFLEDCISY